MFITNQKERKKKREQKKERKELLEIYPLLLKQTFSNNVCSVSFI